MFNHGNITRNLKYLFTLTKPENVKIHTCKVSQDLPYSLGFSFSNSWMVL